MADDERTEDDTRTPQTERWRELPERTRPEDLVSGHRDPAVPGSVMSAPDAQQEFTIRHAAG
ncbi:MAG: hypothetical protein JWP48_1150 [Actinoallomurus sp.]|nr:hypothetical protein [Actinoallomurus sp.]